MRRRKDGVVTGQGGGTAPGSRRGTHKKLSQSACAWPVLDGAPPIHPDEMRMSVVVASAPCFRFPRRLHSTLEPFTMASAMVQPHPAPIAGPSRPRHAHINKLLDRPGRE